MDYMHDLKDLLCAELEDYAEKGKKSGKMSMGDLESIHKLTDTVKNILKIDMLEEEGGYSEDGHYMGEEITVEGDPSIYYNIVSETPVAAVTVVKNCRDYLILRGKKEQLFYDYRKEQEEDCYYLRVKLQDGRMAWTSPIWVRRA